MRGLAFCLVCRGEALGKGRGWAALELFSSRIGPFASVFRSVCGFVSFSFSVFVSILCTTQTDRKTDKQTEESNSVVREGALQLHVRFAALAVL